MPAHIQAHDTTFRARRVVRLRRPIQLRGQRELVMTMMMMIKGKERHLRGMMINGRSEVR
jgi:hypothetical protein